MVFHKRKRREGNTPVFSRFVVKRFQVLEEESVRPPSLPSFASVKYEYANHQARRLRKAMLDSVNVMRAMTASGQAFVSTASSPMSFRNIPFTMTMK